MEMKKLLPFHIALSVACLMIGAMGNSLVTDFFENRQTIPTGMVGVEIIEHCVNADDEKWTLLQTDCGQRCYTKAYRGNVGERFFMWPEDISGFRRPDALMNLTSPPVEIELELAKQQKKTDEKS